MYLSWIIPAYNEEKRIERTLREVDTYLKSRSFSGGYEIIVAFSASRDRTAEIIKKMQSEVPGLRLLSLENKGKGWAVKQAMLQARGEIRLFSDADNSTAPEYFDKMRSFFDKGYEVVISSRHPKDVPGASRDVEEPWYRELLGSLGNLVIQIFGVWGIWDTQNGFKAFSSPAADKIFSLTSIFGFAFDIEVLALARRLNYRVAIIPVRWRYELESTVTLKDYLKVFVDVFKIRWYVLINKYKI